MSAKDDYPAIIHREWQEHDFAPEMLINRRDYTAACDEIDEARRITNALPVCPTCDGEPPTADLAPGYFHNCADCTDGRMDVFRALAIARAVMATTYDHLAWTTDQVKAGQYDTHPIIASLRAVKP